MGILTIFQAHHLFGIKFAYIIFMPAYSDFTILADSLKNQTLAIESISRNIANVSTIGYKRQDVRFSEFINHDISNDNVHNAKGLSGAEPFVRATNNVDGNLGQTGNPLDVALSGNGFFITQSDADSNLAQASLGESYQLTDAGSFQRKVVRGDNGEQVAVLTDLGGNVVLGYPYNANTRTFDKVATIQELKPIIIEQATIQRSALSTRSVDLQFQLNPTAVVGDINDYFNFSFNIFDGAISTKSADALTPADYKQEIKGTAKKIAEHQWEITYETANGVITNPVQSLTFDEFGVLKPPYGKQLDIVWNAEPTKPNLVRNQSVSLFNKNILEAVSKDTSIVYNSDGYQDSSLLNVSIAADGGIKAFYTSGQELTIAKLAVLSVRNPDGLLNLTNTHFGFSSVTGDYKLLDPATSTSISLKPGNIENSNVDLTNQFTELLSQQRNYQSVSSALNLVNELYQVAINLYK